MSDSVKLPATAALIMGATFLLYFGLIAPAIDEPLEPAPTSEVAAEGTVEDEARSSGAWQGEPGPKPAASSEPDQEEAGISDEPHTTRKIQSALIADLRERFRERQLEQIARASAEIEQVARNEHGESDAAYARMELDWARLKERYGLTEDERQALEDEAIRKGWLPPLAD